MRWTAVRFAATVTLGAIALGVGCSGGDADEPRDPKRDSQRPLRATDLARPVYPACGTERFGRPRVERLANESNWRVWTVSYTRPSDPKSRRATTTLVIAQYSPRLPRSTVPGAPDVRIAGRLVSFRRPSRKAPGFAAQWKTARARYALIANGTDPGVVRRIIACLP